MPHEPEITDDDVPVVEELKVIGNDFIIRLCTAVANYGNKLAAKLPQETEPKKRTILEWLDDFQEWLTLDELHGYSMGHQNKNTKENT